MFHVCFTLDPIVPQPPTTNPSDTYRNTWLSRGSCLPRFAWITLETQREIKVNKCGFHAQGLVLVFGFTHNFSVRSFGTGLSLQTLKRKKINPANWILFFEMWLMKKMKDLLLTGSPFGPFSPTTPWRPASPFGQRQATLVPIGVGSVKGLEPTAPSPYLLAI